MRRDDDGVHTVVAVDESGTPTEYHADEVVSLDALRFRLVRVLDPPPPEEVVRAAEGLRFRDFLTVALVVPEKDGFPDNWIYIHSPDVKVGRPELRAQWSALPGQGRAGLPPDWSTSCSRATGCGPGDDLSSSSWLQRSSILGLTDPATVEAGYVVRMPKAYPVYDEGYQQKVRALRDWLDHRGAEPPPGRAQRDAQDNNQDHSMLTAMLTAQNITKGTDHDVWSVNVEADYHETDTSPEAWVGTAEDGGGTGRDVSVVPACRRGRFLSPRPAPEPPCGRSRAPGAEPVADRRRRSRRSAGRPQAFWRIQPPPGWPASQP
ncbi:MAG: hypothetical protein R2716_10820 [Microthrixaceae bacterium]